jgi:preprotein translocase subunit YajC
MTHTAFILLQGQPGIGGFITGILPFVLIFAVFYFLIIVPQRWRQKAGDRIVTSGGIIATVKAVRDRSLVVMSDKSMLEISRGAVAGLHSEEEKA